MGLHVLSSAPGVSGDGGVDLRDGVMPDPQLDESGEGSLLGVFLAIPVALIALVVFAWSLTGSSGESIKFKESSACVPSGVVTGLVSSGAPVERPETDPIGCQRATQATSS